MKILGISAFYHDSASAIVVDGKIVAAAQEERFTRKKHDPSFPKESIAYCLKESGLCIDDLDAVVFYDKPLLKFERLLETYYTFSPRGISSFIMAIPIWLKEKMFLKKIIRQSLDEIENDSITKKGLKLLFPEHHLSHAASTFYPSPFEEAAILTLDGVGEWATASICYGKGKEITLLKELKFPHSVGLLYSAFTYFLGFTVNSGEYKLMGLAPYGNVDGGNVASFIARIERELVEIKEDGSIWLNQRYFTYAYGLKMIHEKKWERLFGFPTRKAEDEPEQHHCDLALAIQMVTENIVKAMAREAKKLSGSENLCLAGGVALNCVANGKLQQENIFKNVYVPPAPGDAGGAIGAALAGEYIYFGRERRADPKGVDSMGGSFLGPAIYAADVEKCISAYAAKAQFIPDPDLLAEAVARLLSEGKIIGWAQGRMEFGPRALGNRSILGDPRNGDMQRRLNLKIKYRESFRPFAPSILAEDVGLYFEYQGTSPYMSFVHPILNSQRILYPAEASGWSLRDKLAFKRSALPAITHIDYTGRIQTIQQETNPKFHKLVSAFKALAGYGLILNTSFNVRGEPIVCSVEDAYRCFMRTEMDYLVMDNYIFSKLEQPTWVNTDNWKEEFKLD